MWFHLEPRGAGYSGALSGVAVSKNVAGPYSFVNAFRPNAGFGRLMYRNYISNLVRFPQIYVLAVESYQPIRIA